MGRLTRNIDEIGKSLILPLVSTDQTVGVTIAGEYEGTFQIVAVVDPDGREIELTPYTFAGQIADLEGQSPVDFWVDVAGFVQLRIEAVGWSSGIANITANSTSAKRSLSNSGGVATDVNVLNFPTTGAKESTSQEILGELIGIDADEAALPSNFGSYPVQFTWHRSVEQTEVKTVNGKQYTTVFTSDIIDTLYKDVSGSRYTKTFNYDNSWVLTGVSSWVKS